MEPVSVSADGGVASAWVPRIAYWGPILAPILGGAAIIAGNLLGTVCTQYLPGENGCATYGLSPIGEAFTFAGLLGIVLGLYAIFAPRRVQYAHTCASCGKDFTDTDPRGERHVAGQAACSDACADKLADALRLEELGAKIDALEIAARQASNDVMRDRAVERLREIADEGSEPYRSRAKDALTRVEAR